jgi:hypothetical protein
MSGRRYHGDFHLSCLNEVNGFRSVTLREDFFILTELQYCLAFCNCVEQIGEIWDLRQSWRALTSGLSLPSPLS